MTNSDRRFRALICSEKTNPGAVREMQIFRKDLFVDRLGWSLHTVDDKEQDQFDTECAIHCLMYENARLIGGFRAIQSIQPYLAQTIFPHLATTRCFPRRADIFEISRFGVDPGQTGSAAAETAYAIMMRFGQVRQITAFVALVELSHERFLRRLGIRTRRYGRPQIVGISSFGRPLMAVAGEIPFSDQTSGRFRNLMKLVNDVEFTDETLVFGHWALSA